MLYATRWKNALKTKTFLKEKLDIFLKKKKNKRKRINSKYTCRIYTNKIYMIAEKENKSGEPS